MEPHTYIGTTKTGSDVWLSRYERLEHIAVIGATGTGKSTLIEHLVAQDMARGDGVLLLDPNGPLAEAALQFVPSRRRNHVCYLNVPDLEWPVGINVLEDVHPDRRAVLVDGVVSAMRSIWVESWGPRMEQILRHAARALIEVPNASLVLVPRLLTDDGFRRSVVSRVSDPFTRAFFGDRFEKWRNDYREVAIDPVLNKVEAFLAFPHVGVSAAGIFRASWFWIVVSAMTLFLLGFSRWRDTIEKAGTLDADLRELGRLAFAVRLFGIGFDLYARSHNVALVLIAKFGLDSLFLAGVYVVGRTVGWLMGIDAEVFSLEQP